MATKAQHYVWRGYLKRWTPNNNSKDKLFVYYKRPMGNLPQLPNDPVPLMRVGFENYFYDMTGFNQNDIAFLERLIRHMERDALVKLELDPVIFKQAQMERDFVESVMCGYEDIDNRNKFLERIVNNDLSFYQDSVVQVVLDKLRNVAIHSPIASMCGLPQPNQRELLADFQTAMEHMEHMEDDDLKFDFLLFFCMQYLRSPVRMRVQKERFEEAKRRFPQEIGDKHTNFYVNALTMFFAWKMALNLSMNPHTWIERLENRTAIPFVTSDTPAINLTGAEFQEKNEFYYPVSPSVAIKLCYADKGNPAFGKAANRNIELEDASEARRLNLEIARQCENEIFADCRSVLEEIAKEA